MSNPEDVATEKNNAIDAIHHIQVSARQLNQWVCLDVNIVIYIQI